MFVDVTVLQQLVRPVVIYLRISIDIASCTGHLVGPDDVCDFSEPRIVQATGMVGLVTIITVAKEPVRLEVARDALLEVSAPRTKCKFTLFSTPKRSKLRQNSKIYLVVIIFEK